jgi:hypothetical protein
MPQVAGVGPFDESDLADQSRFDPSTLVHFLCGQGLAPPRGSFLRQILEGTLDGLECLKGRGELISNSQHKAVFHLRNEDEFFLLVDAHEQTNSCSMLVRTLIQAPDRSPDS